MEPQHNNREVSVGHILALAAVYVVSAHLCTLLEIPYGLGATPLWAPTGISLACLLVYGARITPGLLLGASLWTWVILTQKTDAYSAKWASLALTVGLGTIGQAYLTTWLIRRYVKNPFDLRSVGDVLKFLTFGPLLGSIVTPAISLASTGLNPLISLNASIYEFLTWYIGNVLGILAFTPLSLMLISKRGTPWRSKLFSVGIPLSLATCFVAVLFAYANQREKQHLRLETQTHARFLTSNLSRTVETNLTALSALKGFFESANDVRPEEFSSFVAPILARHPAMIAINWLPLPSQRYAVPYVETDAASRAILSHPPWITPAARDAMTRAASAGTLVSSRAFDLRHNDLIHGATPHTGFLIVAPVYLPTANSPIPALSGYVIATLQVSSLITTSMPGLGKTGFVLDIDDRGASGTHQHLFWNLTHRRAHADDTFIRRQAAHEVAAQTELNLLNRKWELNFRRKASFLSIHRGWYTWFVLLGSLVLLYIIAAFLLIQAGHTAQIEALVAERTLELVDARAKTVNAAKLAALGEMAGGVAHEINNPLAVIHGTAQQIQRLIERRELKEIQLRTMLSTILTTTKRIASIIKGLKTLSSGSDTEPFEVRSLEEILTDTLVLCAIRLDGRNVELLINSSDKRILVACRPVQICQVLVNLLNNAFDATKGLEHPRIEIEIAPPAAASAPLQISVIDNGAGIPEELTNKIMQPFFTTKDPGKGTGLGLSVSLGIMRAHGGDLTFASSPGRTVFVLHLPAHEESHAAAS